MKNTTVIAAGVAALVALSATPAAAQWSNLRNALPGASRASAGDPDAFLHETIQTTKLVMSSAALLAEAASANPDKEALRAQLGAIESASSPRDLQSQKASFDANVASIQQHAADAAALEARYEQASAAERQMMLTAAYNFTIGMVRNTELARQAPDMISSLATNPMNLTKIGHLRTSASLLGDQVQATRSMIGPMRTLLSRGGVEVPADATASDARPIDLDAF